MQASIKLAAALLTAAVLGGCASGVTRMDAPSPGVSPAATAPIERAVKSVTLSLSEEAKKLVIDNLKFNQETLRTTVERALSGQNLVKADAVQVLDIEITSFRTRSNFTAIMFGFMAGSDNVEGIVSVKDMNGNVLKRAKVSASYALGGIAGGQDDARMSWLYEEFAKHTVAELAVLPSK
jgi:hypothetical protein